MLQDGFPDSHFVCFPYETRRTGIYAAGAVRAPMDEAHAREDAMGAALKAIQSVELAARGLAVHPRGGDLSYPSFFLQRCTQCKRCTEECPFGALDEDVKGHAQAQPVPLPALRRLHGRLPGAHHFLPQLLGGHDRLHDQGHRGSRGGRREAAHPGPGLRERRLSGARPGGPQAAAVRSQRARDPAALPGLAQHRVDRRRALARHRRRDAGRLQVRRRLPVPLHQGQRAGRKSAWRT